MANTFSGFGDGIIRLIRTWVPLVIGFIVDSLAGTPLEGVVNLSPEAAIVAAIGVYYAVVAFLENKVHPAFGWLLGAPKQ